MEVEEVIELANRYKKTIRGENKNSRESIDAYQKWFIYSKALFAKYFDKSDEFYSQFISYDTNGNGFTLLNNFSRQFPIFELLIAKIKQEILPLKDTKMKNQEKKTNKCFIIHGHNDTLKLEVARLIEKDFSIEAIILHEQANKGKTIIEKFETYSIVDFAIALWTFDDLGKGIKDDDLKPRARQNVIFETGYFLGRLGRDKVIILYESGIEIPSDYQGVVYIDLSGNWMLDLIKEIKGIYQ